jgi:hypothetical protein
LHTLIGQAANVLEQQQTDHESRLDLVLAAFAVLGFLPPQ